MPWVVDTCLLIDIAEEDPNFCDASAILLDARRPDGLILCPISYVELAPVFEGDKDGLNEFLREVGVQWPVEWTIADTTTAFVAWRNYVTQKRQGSIPKHPMPIFSLEHFLCGFEDS